MTLKKPSAAVAKNEAEPSRLVRAVFLKASNGAEYGKAKSFQPVYVLTNGTLVGSGLEQDWVRDTDGNRSVPLSADSIRFTRGLPSRNQTW